MEGGKKRRSRQLLKTVQMKISVLEKQKEDIVDIINDFTDEVISKARSFTQDGDDVLQSPDSYHDLVRRLDVTSEILSKIAISLDDIIDEEVGDKDRDVGLLESIPTSKSETPKQPEAEMCMTKDLSKKVNVSTTVPKQHDGSIFIDHDSALHTVPTSDRTLPLATDIVGKASSDVVNPRAANINASETEENTDGNHCPPFLSSNFQTSVVTRHVLEPALPSVHSPAPLDSDCGLDLHETLPCSSQSAMLNLMTTPHTAENYDCHIANQTAQNLTGCPVSFGSSLYHQRPVVVPSPPFPPNFNPAQMWGARGHSIGPHPLPARSSAKDTMWMSSGSNPIMAMQHLSADMYPTFMPAHASTASDSAMMPSPFMGTPLQYNSIRRPIIAAFPDRGDHFRETDFTSHEAIGMAQKAVEVTGLEPFQESCTVPFPGQVDSPSVNSAVSVSVTTSSRVFPSLAPASSSFLPVTTSFGSSLISSASESSPQSPSTSVNIEEQHHSQLHTSSQVPDEHLSNEVIGTDGIFSQGQALPSSSLSSLRPQRKGAPLRQQRSEKLFTSTSSQGSAPPYLMTMSVSPVATDGKSKNPEGSQEKVDMLGCLPSSQQTKKLQPLKTARLPFAHHPKGASQAFQGPMVKDLDKLFSKVKDSIAQSGKQSKTANSISGGVSSNDKPTTKASPESSAKQKSPRKGPTISPAKWVKDEILAATVTRVEDPWAFYVKSHGEEKDINKKIRVAENEGLEKKNSPEVGDFCLARFSDGLLHRAQILALKDGGSLLKVIFVDYGNTSTVDVQQVFELPRVLTKPACLAACCALNGVRPENPENLWTQEAILAFEELCSNTEVVLRVLRPADNENSQDKLPYIVDIVVKMPVTKKSRSKTQCKAKNISSILVDKNYAVALSFDDLVEILTKVNAGGNELSPLQQQDLAQLASSTDIFLATKRPKSPASSVHSGSHSKFPTPACFLQSSSKNLKQASKKSQSSSSSSSSMSSISTPHSRLEERDMPEQPEIQPEKAVGRTENSAPKKTSLDHLVDEKLRCLKKSLTRTLESPEGDSDSDLDSESELTFESSGTLKSISVDNGLEVEFQVMMSKVISPSSFFVHLVTEESGHQFDQLTQGLNKIFEAYSSKALLNLSMQFVLKKNKLCCAIFSGDIGYYRGLVLDVRKRRADSSLLWAHNVETEEILVFFIDYGDSEWVARSRVYRLPTQFKQIPPMVLWCSLVYVSPPQTSSRGNHAVVNGGDAQQDVIPVPKWCAKTVRMFKAKVSGDKTLCAVVSQEELLRVNDSQSFQLQPLPVYLLNKNGKEEICLNHELIQLGLAEVKTDAKEPVENTELQDWDPMADDFSSIRNSYKVDITDPGVALVGVGAGQVGRDGRRVCVFYNRARGCYRGQRCPNLHIRVDEDGLSYDKVPVKMFRDDQSDLLPEPDSLVVATVSTVISPGQFYVTLPWQRLTLTQVKCDLEALRRQLKEETLQGLMENMQEFYRISDRYDGDLTLLARGQAMAARVHGLWHRVKVIDADVENGTVQVLCVDFGNIEMVPEVELRELDLRFIHLTLQAVECSLDGLEPVDSTGRWPKSVCEEFAQSCVDKILVAHVKHRFLSDRLSVELYDSSGEEAQESLNKQLMNKQMAQEGQKKSQLHPETNGGEGCELEEEEDVLPYQPV
ncbi:uncharacterized protein LOC101856642 [Aplysia californica]|uniref:Uncharacterized protein LOC101856642 n=1 Tax=Aplysia californica TaxID=6500 RepID=A0ABM0ZWL8_APLCA|nr:uncharacterized protein LOC101856642 [Aplysia californica]